MINWLPTRFLAATIDVDDTGDLTCENFFNEAKDPDNSTMNVDEICNIFKFDNLTSFYHVAMGNKIADLKEPLMEMTNMTEKEFGNLYNVSDEKSLGHLIAQVDLLVKDTYGCENTCTATELSVMQWTNSKVTKTVPENLEGNRFLGRNGDTCISDAWKLDGVYEFFPCSEFSNYLS